MLKNSMVLSWHGMRQTFKSYSCMSSCTFAKNNLILWTKLEVVVLSGNSVMALVSVRILR
jgi:hypothetical protein